MRNTGARSFNYEHFEVEVRAHPMCVPLKLNFQMKSSYVPLSYVSLLFTKILSSVLPLLKLTLAEKLPDLQIVFFFEILKRQFLYDDLTTCSLLNDGHLSFFFKCYFFLQIFERKKKVSFSRKEVVI